MRKGSASSDTDESGVSASFARIARRVGSASAWNVASRAAAPEWLTIWLTIMPVEWRCQEGDTVNVSLTGKGARPLHPRYPERALRRSAAGRFTASRKATQVVLTAASVTAD